jgi:succinyl-diaminopimelate desuccinylase
VLEVPPSLGNDGVALLRQLIAFNTVNPPGNELEAQTFLKQQLEGAGFESELVGERPERPNLVALLPLARRHRAR